MTIVGVTYQTILSRLVLQSLQLCDVAYDFRYDRSNRGLGMALGLKRRMPRLDWEDNLDLTDGDRRVPAWNGVRGVSLLTVKVARHHVGVMELSDYARMCLEAGGSAGTLILFFSSSSSQQVEFKRGRDNVHRLIAGSRAWFRSTDLWVMGPARFHLPT